MKINGFHFLLLAFLLLMLGETVYYPFRYLKYFLPILPAIFFLNYGQELKVNKTVLNYYLTFLVFYLIVFAYLFIMNLVSLELSARFLPNAMFILTPLLFITLSLPFFKPEKINLYIKSVFFLNILIYLFEVRSNIFDVFSALGSLATAHMPGEITTESEMGFVFGFFLIYFLMEKGTSMLYILLALLFTIISFKRIVIAGVIGAIGLYLLMRLFRVDVRKHKLKLTAIGIAANLSIIYIAQLLTLGEFDHYIFEHTGLSTDAFMLGRKTFYTHVFEEFGSYNLGGLGLGKVDDSLQSFLGYPMNLHSELIKNYLEFGLFIFLVWLSMIIYKNLFSNRAAIFLAYFNILLLTDNIFIYFHGMFYFYFFILIFLYREYSDPNLILIKEGK